MKNTSITKLSDWFEGDDKEIISSLTRIINCYPNVKFNNQPERLSEKTYYRNEDGTYPLLEPVIGCDSPNSENK
jgi:hypothetical protein